MTEPDQQFCLNGIDGSTGNYLVPPLAPAAVAAMARRQPVDGQRVSWLKRIWEVLQRPFLGLPLDVDPTDVARAGWAVVFAPGTPPEVRRALEPLLAHRRNRVPPDRCKVLEYRPGEGLNDWLGRYGSHSGAVVPTKVPYYLMLVGDPSAIPFEFQYLLDVEYAVGRVAFDRPEPYRHYAESVVAYETAGAVPNSREVVYWGPRHAADRATQLSADCLITPLAHGVPATADQPKDPAIAETLGYRWRCLKGPEATKASLVDVLHTRDAAPPALLFTASHGMGWPKGHEQQRPAQGALLCQDWSGFGSVRPSHYLTAAEVADDARLHGLVAFLFACYGTGTPAFDNFLAAGDLQGPVPIAEQPFVAALPQRLLSHPQGGALAVIGHVDRAWGYSIRPPGVGPQLVPFRNLIGRVLSGEPVGHATKDFSEKYAVLSTELLSKLDKTQPGPRPGDDDLAWTWVERNDAQNYVVLGDPAVRLRVDLLK